MKPLLVIKIGGSLYTSKQLPKWLHTLSNLKGYRIIVVPGGGPFADTVRQAYKNWPLSESVAHDMAVLAMQQYAQLLVGVAPKLVLASNIGAIKQYWRNDRVVVWEPAKLVKTVCTLPRTWDTTSDALSAWLSTYLHANMLILVKSVKIKNKQICVRDLVNRNIVDKNFGKHIRNARFKAGIAYVNDYKQFKGMLSKCLMPGALIVDD